MKDSGSSKNRKNKIRLSVFFSACLLFSLLFLLNWLTIRRPLRYDLVGNESRALAPATTEIVQKLQKPLQITIFDRAIAPTTKALLISYQNQSSNFEYQLVDPDGNPNHEQGDVLLEYGDLTKTFHSDSNLFGIEIKEVELSNAIAKVLQLNIPDVYWLKPNGEVRNLEAIYSQAMNALQEKGYQNKTLDLVNYIVPENASTIVIAKPLQKLSRIEVSRLQQYLNNGGSLLVMLLPNTEVGLGPIWQEYGIELDNRLLINGSSNNERQPIEIKTDLYSDNPITDGLVEAAIFANSRPIKVLPQSEIEAISLITTGDRTWAESDFSQPEISFNSQEDLTGNFTLAVSLEKDDMSRLVVFGNGVFANDTWFKQGANKDLFLATVDWLVGLDRNILDIPEPKITQHRISLESWQSDLIGLLGVKIFPGAAAIIVIILWLFKNQKK